MTMMSLAKLGLVLVADTITWAGYGQPVMLNFTKLTGEQLTPESSALEAATKLLNGLYQLQIQVNQERAAAQLPPIHVVTRSVDTTDAGNPIVNIGLSLEIDLNAALGDLVDPTEA